MSPEQITRRELLRVAIEGAQADGRRFTKPDDDWAPVALVAVRDGLVPVLMQFGNDFEKDLMAMALAQLIREQEATAVVTVLSAWQVELDPNDPATEVYLSNVTKPAKSPRREEVLIVGGFDRLGDEFRVAHIVRRDGRPPQLTPFKPFPDGERHTGRFVEPLRRALREVTAGDGFRRVRTRARDPYPGRRK